YSACASSAVAGGEASNPANPTTLRSKPRRNAWGMRRRVAAYKRMLQRSFNNSIEHGPRSPVEVSHVISERASLAPALRPRPRHGVEPRHLDRPVATGRRARVRQLRRAVRLRLLSAAAGLCLSGSLRVG